MWLCAREHHLNTKLCTRYDLFVVLYDVEIFLVRPADHRILYALLLSWWGKYKWHFVLLVSTSWYFTYLNSLFPRRGHDYTRLIISPGVSQLGILMATNFSLYAFRALWIIIWLGRYALTTSGAGCCFGCRPLRSVLWDLLVFTRKWRGACMYGLCTCSACVPSDDLSLAVLFWWYRWVLSVRFPHTNSA